MSSDRVFQISLLVSLLVHGIILTQNSNFTLSTSKGKKDNDNIEVSYLKPPKQTRAPLQKATSKTEQFLKLPDKITTQESALSPSLNKEVIFKAFSKPVFIRPEVIAVKAKITLASTEPEKVASPTYLAHSQIVREKIKRSLYQNYNQMEEGQVYISFILSREGYLKDVHLIEEQSSVSAYLREISLRSIKDASPFPKFPKALDYDQLTFNVIISFEIE